MNGIKRMLAGLGLAAGVMVTQPVMAAGPAPVDLGSAARFTILAGAAVTTTGGGAIDGDVGASPIAGSAIHLTAAQVHGTIYTVDHTGPAGSVMDPVMLTTAKGNLTTAYNDAAGRTPVPTENFLNPNGGNIGGLNLVPGLYKFTGPALIRGTDVTLTGGPDDVWIFQIAADLQVGSGIKVILAGGAQAKNIFWQVGTSAVLGTFSVFKGTIMADQAITMKTSSTMEGRALAFSAGVTFNGSSASLPTSGPVIKANGVTKNITVNYPGTVSVTVELNPGDHAGVPVDWWIVAYANGGWYYLNDGMQWKYFNGNLAYCQPVHQGPLFNLSSRTVFDGTLPRGTHYFWFAVDYPMDGILNPNGQILFDRVTVVVQQ